MLILYIVWANPAGALDPLITRSVLIDFGQACSVISELYDFEEGNSSSSASPTLQIFAVLFLSKGILLLQPTAGPVVSFLSLRRCTNADARSRIRSAVLIYISLLRSWVV